MNHQHCGCVLMPSRKTSGETWAIAAYIKKALIKSLVILKPKRRRLSFQGWFCLGSTKQANSATSVQVSLAAKGIKMIHLPPNSLAITPSDFFLFP